MLPRRTALVLAFAGGCLSTAVLVGMWGRDGEPSATPSRAAVVERAVDARPHLRAAPRDVVMTDEATIANSGVELGSSVADVLTRLETAYREQLEVAEEPPEPPVEVPPAPPPPPVVVVPAPAPAPPANVQVNVQRDVYNGDVHQGDVNQLQQAVLQYAPLVMVPANGYVARPPVQTTPRSPARTQPPPAHIQITNPDNPWGFHFKPTPLVK